jgi:hypothetical protein
MLRTTDKLGSDEAVASPEEEDTQIPCPRQEATSSPELKHGIRMRQVLAVARHILNTDNITLNISNREGRMVEMVNHKAVAIHTANRVPIGNSVGIISEGSYDCAMASMEPAIS